MSDDARAVGEHFATAVAILEAKLAKLKADYDRIGDNVEDKHAKDRFAAHQSLLYVLEFIDSFPPWKQAQLGFALRRLLLAIANIHEGRREEWLENSLPHRWPLSIQAQAVRGHCAGIMELLMSGAITPKRGRQYAAEFVMRHLPKEALATLAGPDANWRTVARWREHVTGNADEGPELDAYRHCLSMPVAWTESRAQAELRRFASLLNA